MHTGTDGSGGKYPPRYGGSQRAFYLWLPPLFFAEGFPAAVITEVSLVLFYCFGMTGASVAFWTHFLGLIPLLGVKLFCAPAIDALFTRRSWILAAQWILAALFLCAGIFCRATQPLAPLIALFFFAALVSGVHDVAADGFYILALTEHEQALCSGLRSVFYRLALIAGSGGLVILSGILSEKNGNTPAPMSPSAAWSWTMFAAALPALLIALYDTLLLPRPLPDCPKKPEMSAFFRDFRVVFQSFFRKKHIGTAMLFLLLYRLGEAQLGAVSKLFLIGKDGLALTNTQYGFLAGTAGVVMLLAGGVLSGFLCAKSGFGKMLWPMAIAINAPDVLYLLLALLHKPSILLTGLCVSVEQFGYGFGFAGYMLFMVWFASTSMDSQKTSHFALMTVFMIAGLRLPGMASGWIAAHIAEWIPGEAGKYPLFFAWVLLCTVPGFLVTHTVSKIVNPDYGKKC